jgi:hypothetical protein
LLESSIELQEVTYLVQNNFRISPNPEFTCSLLFQTLNKSIGTKHEDIVYTLCDKWLDLLLVKPESEIENIDSTNTSVRIKCHKTSDIAAIFRDTSSYLVKYLNYSYFSGVVGASEITFKKAKLISELFFINRTTNSFGEMMLEKAFVESREDPELSLDLEKSFKNIVTWLFLSSGEHTGPIKKYIKAIESQCKYIIQVASDIKNPKYIESVVEIYKMLMRNLKDLLAQNRIPVALAYSKAKTIHSILESIFSYLLVTDEIANYFVFEQHGFDYFLKQLISEKSKVEVNDDDEEKIDTSPGAKERLASEPTSVSNKDQNLNDDELNDELYDYICAKMKSELDLSEKAQPDDMVP